jgi:hypothetical protein
MKTSTAVGVGLTIVVVVVGIGVFLDTRSSDEGPIRVRNGGSMLIEAAEDREWEAESGDDEDPNSPSYSHEPTGIDLDPFDQDLYVKVLHSGGTCTDNDITGDGRIVRVVYTPATGPSFTATFKRAKSGAIKLNRRTKVRPPNGLDLMNPTTLRHAPAGYISAVHVNNWNCTFDNAGELQYIDICSSANRLECQ